VNARSPEFSILESHPVTSPSEPRAEGPPLLLRQTPPPRRCRHDELG